MMILIHLQPQIRDVVRFGFLDLAFRCTRALEESQVKISDATDVFFRHVFHGFSDQRCQRATATKVTAIPVPMPISNEPSAPRRIVRRTPTPANQKTIAAKQSALMLIELPFGAILA